MVAEPAETPVTNPVDGFTVAIAPLLVVHVPPVFPFVVNCVVPPVHIFCVPLKVPAFGGVVTVTKTSSLTEQPLYAALIVYVAVLVGFTVGILVEPPETIGPPDHE